MLGGSVAAGMHLKRKKNSSWQSYAKRDDVSKLFGKKGKPGFRKIGNVSDKDASALMAMQGKYGKGKVSKSAFGVDHEVSKASILGQGSRLAHEAGAGGIAAAKLGEGMGPARHPSSFAYGAHRAQAGRSWGSWRVGTTRPTEMCRATEPSTTPTPDGTSESSRHRTFRPPSQPRSG